MVHRLACLVALFCAIPNLTFAECAPRPTVACELANSADDVFVARAVSLEVEPDLWRVRVVRSYRGRPSGNILLKVETRSDSGFERLEPGKDYLFYASKVVEHGKPYWETGVFGCASWLPIEIVSREELAYLDGLASHINRGRVFGTAIVGPSKAKGIANARITLKGRGRQFS